MFAAQHAALPDPQTKPEFYHSIPSKRLLAWALDAAATLALSVLISLMTLGLGFFIFFFITTLVSFFYRWLSLSAASATPGMRLMAIELRRADGRRLDSSTALLHTLGFHLSLAFPIAQLASIVMMLASEKRQGLSDMALGTAMINRPLNP